MSDQETRAGNGDLQFDRAVTGSPSSAPSDKPAVVCFACQASIETNYYDVNGKPFCGRCRAGLASAAETPRGMIPLVTAGAFGIGAGIVGAVIYYAVIAITHFEIGIVAILIGWMVGYAVRKGARGRGGLRFQILAVALTYVSIGLAYTPIAFRHAFDTAPQAQAPATTPGNAGNAAAADDGGSAPATKASGGRLLFAVVLLLALIAALPVLVVWGSFPSGLISAFIIFIGMKQAWRMTGAPRLEILGPYRVGTATTSAPA